MVERLISLLLLWGMEGCFAWYVAHEYAIFVNRKLALVSHALSVFK